jgi:ribosome biogenesis GTPase A
VNNSLLKNLKITKMANVGVNPSVTKAMQEMHLDMRVKLLDYFGTIFVSSKNSEVFATF